MAYCDSMAAELVDHLIDVTTVYMPLVRTDMITPTKAYDNAPKLNSWEGGRLITSAMIDRPYRVAPPAAVFSATARAIAPGTTRRALHVAEHFLPR